MKLLKKLVIVACILAMLVPALGCESEGPMEEAGKKIDQAAEDAEEAAKKIFD